jgi:hypothetical protein
VQQHKAHHLFRWARDAGKSVSRDEVADMVRRQTLTSVSNMHLCKHACCISEDAATQWRTQRSPNRPAGGCAHAVSWRLSFATLV